MKLTMEITTGDITSIVHYICPPSALQPIPSTLLSLPLRQRHHFLNITPDDPESYLTWPSPHSHSVLPLLEAIKPDDLPLLLDAHGHDTIRYLADAEAVYAHVRITPTAVLPSSHPNTQSSVRLVFLWDEPTHSWRYHNSAIGLFPNNSHLQLSHAMALFQSPDDFLPERTYAFGLDNIDDDDTAYWDAYNTIGDDSQPTQPSVKQEPVVDTEDAYWAQYSSIQGSDSPQPHPDLPSDSIQPSGSADSTIPSPRPLDRKLQDPTNRIFVPSSELNPDIPHTEVYNPLAPPSPTNLSRRLASLPTRPDSPPLQDDEPSSASASSASLSPTSPSVEFPQGSLETTAADEALKDTFKALYRLWSAGSSSKSQQDFLTLVQQAIVN